LDDLGTDGRRILKLTLEIVGW